MRFTARTDPDGTIHASLGEEELVGVTRIEIGGTYTSDPMRLALTCLVPIGTIEADVTLEEDDRGSPDNWARNNATKIAAFFSVVAANPFKFGLQQVESAEQAIGLDPGTGEALLCACAKVPAVRRYLQAGFSPNTGEDDDE